MGIAKLAVIANKVQGKKEEDYLNTHLQGFNLVGFLPYDKQIKEKNMGHSSLLTLEGETIKQLKKVFKSWR